MENLLCERFKIRNQNETVNPVLGDEKQDEIDLKVVKCKAMIAEILKSNCYSTT